MKNSLQIIIFLVIGLFFSACGQITTATPSPIPSPRATVTATATFMPIPSPTETVQPTSRPEFVPPTLIPTIDPALVSDLLRNAFSIRTAIGVNGHKIRQITGWDHGFGAGMYQYVCSGYYWLDNNHLLLYPQAGQRLQSLVTDAELPIGVAPQSVIINLKDGAVWLPPVAEASMSKICDRIYWSPELGILINSEVQNDTSTVSTYTYDGHKLASYPGNLADISPSRTKILLEDNTLVDLRTDKRITLDWSLEDYQEEMLSEVFWTSDESHLYRCCYFYADLRTGVSYRFERSDFQDIDGNHLDPYGLWFYRGGWVRDNDHFLVTWSYIDDGDIRYLPMFDPAKKKFYDVRKMAGIPEDWTVFRYDVSWDGKYVWLMGGEGSYLIDLLAFEARYYPDLSYVDTEWSPNSQYIRLHLDEGINQTHQYSEYSILSIADNEIRSFPVKPINDYVYWWHESDSILIYPSVDEKTLILLDAETLSFWELPFRAKSGSGSLAWSPNGDHIAMVAEDGSLWQVDYPKMENLEQLTPPLPDGHDVNWSPDGSSIAFISGSDIYIVETNK